MDEFGARKLGEVLAFAETGTDTLQKGEIAVLSAAGEKQYREWLSQSRAFTDAIRQLASAKKQLEPVEKKANATNQKIRDMRDAYIGDSWDDATEIYEWQGFFLGAAMVHWALIRGLAESADIKQLEDLAEMAGSYYGKWLYNVQEFLRARGASRP